jgi:hypothetical protein
LKRLAFFQFAEREGYEAYAFAVSVMPPSFKEATKNCAD